MAAKENSEQEISLEKKVLESENTACDNDLDALLDDALEDFDKPLKKLPINDEKSVKNTAASEDEFNPVMHDDELLKMTEGWSEILEEMAKQDPEVLQQFQNFQENFNAGVEGGPPKDFDENIAKTLDDLTKNLEGLDMEGQIPGFEDMMKEMHGSAGGFDGEMEGGDAFMGMMQGMMENLLSKEMLYPSLKEIRDKYPSWLEKNRGKLKAEELSRYTSQEKLVNELCKLFEEQTEQDDDQSKKDRTAKIVELMQTMQTHGQPPTDMMDEIAMETNNGMPPNLPQMPQMPTNPQDCSIM